MALGDVIARLSVALNLETAAFERNVGKAKREVSGFQSHVSKAGLAVKTAVVGMLGVFAIDNIIQVAKAGLEYASSLGEVASQLGVTTKALQEYRYAASQAGVEQGEMDLALAQLTRRLGDAAQGVKEPLKALERLGISVRDANGHVLDAGEAIPLIAEGLQKLQSPAERAAILVDLFGKSGQKLSPLLEGGAAGVTSLTDAAQKLGIVLSDEQINKADETADKLSALKQVLEAKIAGAVADNTDTILELVDALTKLVEQAGKAAKAWRYFANLDWSWNAPSISQQFQAMAVRDLGPGVELTPGAAAAIAARRNAPFVAPRGGNLLARPPRSSAPATTQTPWGPLLARPGITRAVGAVSGLSAFAPGGGASDWIKASQASANVASAAARIEAANKGAFAALRQMADVSGPKLVAVLGQATPQMEALRAAAQGILDRLFPEQAELRQYQEDMATLTAAMKAGQLSTEDYAKAVNALRQEYNGFAEELRAQQQIVTTGIGPTLDDFVAQADASWERFSSNLVDGAKVSRVQVVQTFEDMAQDVLNSLSQLSGAIRGGGFFDILTGVLGFGLSLGKAGVFGSGFAEALNRVPGNANGTNNWRGGLSWVGERGPELVDLPRGARVTPNNELGRMASVQVIPSPYFDVVVDGRIVRAAPAIAQAGATGGLTQVRRMNSRRLA
ncbi:MAG: phage tail tape measure protein [Sphingopyxis sp.]